MRILSFIIALTASLSLYAQELNSAYFLDGYKYSHRLNPAFAPTRSYIGLPGIGGFGIATRSNLSQDNFLFPYNNGLTTFLSSKVSSEQFLSTLRQNNYLGADISVNLFSLGFWGNKGFTSVELTVKSGLSAKIPYEFFSFIKNLGTQEYYEITDFNLNSVSYTELSIGHARAINRNLNIGGKLKLLSGIANLDLQMQDIQVTTSEDEWSLKSTGVLYYNLPEKTEEGSYLNSYFNSAINYGFAVDLGMEYKFSGMLNGLNLSLAIMDLGFINWNKNTFYAYSNDNSWEFTGFDEFSFEVEAENNLNTQVDALIDGFSELDFFQDTQTTESLSFLNYYLRLGAEYKLPFLKAVSFGFLYTYKPINYYAPHEGRVSFNFSPFKLINLSVNYGVSNLGINVGGAINMDFPGIGLFIGSDSFTWRYRTIGNIPIPYGDLNLHFGLTLNLSSRRTL